MADFKPSQIQGTVISTSTQEVILAEGTDTAVAANTLTTLVSFTMTIADKDITRISCSGEFYAKFDIFVNTVRKETLRSGPSRNVEFTFQNFVFSVGDIVDVKVTHAYTGKTPEFNTTIYGF